MRANPTRLLSTLKTLGVIGLLLTLNACFLFGGGGKKKGGEGQEQATNEPAVEEQQFTAPLEVARTLTNAGKYDEALLIYEETLAQDSLGVAGAKSLDAIGDIYVTLLKYDLSIQAFQRLITDFPTYEGLDRVNKKLAFARTALEVRDQRLKMAKEGPTTR